MCNLCESRRSKMFFITGNFNNKETPTQLFSCGFCEDTFFTVAAYVHTFVYRSYENVLTAKISSL